ncbi:helicase [Aureococcus anophagefferens]|nr:helicase [Aureococcus anophagefferens]
MAPRSWCEVCRGGADGGEELVACGDCPRRFHVECAGLRRAADAGAGWTCGLCGASDGADAAGRKKRVAFVRGEHKELKRRAARFFRNEKAKLAPFVVGVNWFLERHALGVGGILGDEMGLGKTVQTLAFLGALKASGKPGPHLIVTPLAVLQNWVNEIKKFTPSLTVAKVHGSIAERERVLGTVLLTGTPLQNNLGELWALLQFVLPTALGDSKLDDERKLPKHRRPGGLRGADDARTSIWTAGRRRRRAALTPQQLLQRVLQLAKVANHPKTLSLTYDREVAAAACRARQAVGAEFVTVSVDDALSDVAKARDRELRGLAGAGLVRSSGKLALLDRLLARKKAAGSRVLLFSQFTLTLDVLEEYCAAHHGDRGVGYLRLDGATGRIQREMDMRSFNASENCCWALVMSGARELSDEGEAADLEKLDVTELWSILSAGAAAMFDPTAEQGEDPADELLDKLIGARPAASAVRVAEEPSAERPAADLAGTIFERDGAVASSSDDEGRTGLAELLELDARTTVFPEDGLNPCAADVPRLRREAAARSLVVRGVDAGRLDLLRALVPALDAATAPPAGKRRRERKATKI